MRVYKDIHIQRNSFADVNKSVALTLSGSSKRRAVAQLMLQGKQTHHLATCMIRFYST